MLLAGCSHERTSRGLDFGLVDLVDEDDAREADFVELLENELEGGRLLVIGFADDDGGIAAQQRGAGVLREFDGAWTVDEGVAVAEKGGGRRVELDAHAVGAGFRSGVANGGFLGDAALARNSAGAKQNGFE